MLEHGSTPVGFLASLDEELRELDRGGFFKRERVLGSPRAVAAFAQAGRELGLISAGGAP